MKLCLRAVVKIWAVAWFAICLTACAAGKPSVIILSPPSGSQFFEGEDIAVQSSTTDSVGVVRVELVVDGNVVRVDPSPTAQGQPNFTLIQTWKAAVGIHTILVRAYNASGAVSDPAGVSVNVLQKTAQAPTSTPTIPSAPIPSNVTVTPSLVPPTITPSPVPQTPGPSTCTNTAAFVQDVTVPDGTNWAPGQAFNKIWQVRNTGTCNWSGYQLVFASGEAMTTNSTVAVPATAPGATTDLLVPMTAPTATGAHAGQWRLRSSTGLFGPTLSVSINVISSGSTPTVPPPASCPGAPVIASFSATPNPITAGSSTTLSWGAVTNADSASIDQGIGGIATPGSTSVSPTTTTTYTLTATGCGGTATRQVTVTVNPAAVVSTTVVRCFIPGESGNAHKSGSNYNSNSAILVGDDNSNNSYRAFFSFDVHDIAGKTIDVGNLNIGSPTVQGSPFNLGSTLWVGIVDYGTLSGSDYSLPGTVIANITSGPSGQYNIKSAIQSAVSASKSRFQIRFHMAMETNSNNVADMFNWAANSVCLTITYH